MTTALAASPPPPANAQTKPANAPPKRYNASTTPANRSRSHTSPAHQMGCI